MENSALTRWDSEQKEFKHCTLVGKSFLVGYVFAIITLLLYLLFDLNKTYIADNKNKISHCWGKNIRNKKSINDSCIIFNIYSGKYRNMYVIHFFCSFRETISVAIRIPSTQILVPKCFLQRQDIDLIDSRANREKILEHLLVPESQIYMLTQQETIQKRSHWQKLE